METAVILATGENKLHLSRKTCSHRRLQLVGSSPTVPRAKAGMVSGVRPRTGGWHSALQPTTYGIYAISSYPLGAEQ